MALIAAGSAAVLVVSGVARGDPAATTNGAPAQIASLRPGEVVERVVCVDQPDQSYALYLPSGYTPERPWPFLVLMDPRGRALIPLELFREAAERLGYIVVSAYGTRSDSQEPRNRMAMRALLPDVERRFSLDRRRLYLAGFSGTARAAWSFGYHLDGVAGVIGVGAGPPPGLIIRTDTPFAFFGAAGTLDYNYDEMWALDKTLDPLGVIHRFEYFEGGHGWPNRTVCSRALGWMELQAIRRKLRPPDEVLTDALYAERLAEAGKLEETGRPFEALIGYRALVEDFSGLRAVDRPRQRVDMLSGLDEVSGERARRAELADEQARHQGRLDSYLGRFHGPGRPEPLARSLRALEIRALQKRAADETDRLAMLSARRRLEHVFVLTSFYLPRDLLERDEPDFALAALNIAREIKPESAQVCLGRARAYAQMNRKRRALKALTCAVEQGRLSAEFIEGDPFLEPLREEDSYRRLIGGIEAVR